MSKLIDIVANIMRLALVDKVILAKETNSYSIYSKHSLDYVGELEESSDTCYFSYLSHRIDEPRVSAVISLVIRFLLDNFTLVKLAITIDNHVYYRITEKL